MNYVYNAPNKLFEYLACGLDVWFPDVMTGSVPYVTELTYPKVIAVNFTELGKLQIHKFIDKNGFTYKASDFYYEKELQRLISELPE